MAPLSATDVQRFSFSPRPNRAHEIPWGDWDESAFDRAREADEPVLLSLATAWSAASHRMDEEAYSDQRVIDLLAEQFVCIRVDADERPDVAARYATGGEAGQPTIAFLTPEGDPIAEHGAMDADDTIEAAQDVLDAWYRDRETVMQQVEASRAMHEAERATARATRVPGVLTPAILDVALEVVEERLGDGGRGNVQPRDLADVIRLWRYAYLRRGMPVGRHRAVEAARALVAGPGYDREHGGFFRSAGGPRERLARDQGAVLHALAELLLSDALDDEADRAAIEDAVRSTASFVMEVLGDPTGAVFHAALAADGAGAEVILDRRSFAGATAVVARGLLQAGLALDRRDWLERGRRIVDFLLARMRAGEAGVYHAYDGAARTLGILDDQSQTLLALLECYEVSGQAHYFEQARQIARLVERDWHDPGFGFCDISAESEDTGLLAQPSFPLLANVDVAEGLIWLGRMTHDERFLERAQETLSSFAHGLEGRGLAAAAYARVVDRLLSAEPEFKIVSEYPAGEPDSVADPLHRAALRLPLAGRTVQRLDRSSEFELLQQLGLPDVPKVAYVCSGTMCIGPLREVEQLLPAVDELIEGPSR